MTTKAESPVNISPFLKTDWTFVAQIMTPVVAFGLFVLAALVR
jgi:hypothetical protein